MSANRSHHMLPVNLKMEAKMLPPAISRNTVAEVKGSVYPEQVFHFFLQLIRNVVKSAGRNAHLQSNLHEALNLEEYK